MMNPSKKILSFSVASATMIAANVSHAQNNYFNNSFEGFFGGTVFEDVNRNGFQNGPQANEVGVEGIVVTLLTETGRPLQTTSTNANGFYYFRGLPAGNYKALVRKPAEFDFTIEDRYNEYDYRFDYYDSDASPITGETDIITITPERFYDFTTDIGLILKDLPNLSPLVLYPDSVTVYPNDPTSVDVLANDKYNGYIDSFFVDDSGFPGQVTVQDNKLVILADGIAGKYEIPYSVIVNGKSAAGTVYVTVDVPALLAKDDKVNAFIGEQVTVDLLANDLISSAVDVVRVVGTDVPGRVFLNRSNNLVIRDTRAVGTFSVEYQVITVDGSRSNAYVTINIEERPIPTTAEDDTAQGKVNETLIIDILANDLPAGRIKDLIIAESNIPGDVSLDDKGDLVINNVTVAGDYSLIYELYSENGTADDATVRVSFAAEPKPEPTPEPVEADTQYAVPYDVNNSSTKDANYRPITGSLRGVQKRLSVKLVDDATIPLVNFNRTPKINGCTFLDSSKQIKLSLAGALNRIAFSTNYFIMDKKGDIQLTLNSIPSEKMPVLLDGGTYGSQSFVTFGFKGLFTNKEFSDIRRKAYARELRVSDTKDGKVKFTCVYSAK